MKDHFKNLLGKFPTVTDKSTQKINIYWLDIKLGQFTLEELNVVQTRIKNRKAASIDELPPEVWKTRKSENNQYTIEWLKKGYILSFFEKYGWIATYI